MTAVIQALQALKKPSHVRITTDSQYVLKGITEWMDNWKRRNWRTAAKKPVKNADLWQTLDKLMQTHQVEWQWVKGHSGHDGNEKADQLANRGIDDQLAG